MALPCAGVLRDGRCWLDLAVVPQSKRTGADGLHDGALRLRLQAPPVDGKANDALVAWLASALRVPKRSVELIAGQTSRRKRVALNLSAEALATWLDTQLGAVDSSGSSAA